MSRSGTLYLALPFLVRAQRLNSCGEGGGGPTILSLRVFCQLEGLAVKFVLPWYLLKRDLLTPDMYQHWYLRFLSSILCLNVISAVALEARSNLILDITQIVFLLIFQAEKCPASRDAFHPLQKMTPFWPSLSARIPKLQYQCP